MHAQSLLKYCSGSNRVLMTIETQGKSKRLIKHSVSKSEIAIGENTAYNSYTLNYWQDFAISNMKPCPYMVSKPGCGQQAGNEKLTQLLGTWASMLGVEGSHLNIKMIMDIGFQ